MLNILKKEILPYAEEYCKSNWNEILSAMKELLALQKHVAHYGLLTLEEDIEFIDNRDFKDIVRLIIDGMDRENIEDFVIANYYSNKLSGLEAYLYLIHACGMLFMPCARIHIITQFQSLVPYTYRQKIFYEVEEKENERLENLIAQGKIEEVLDFEFEEDVFAKTIIKISSEDMLKLIRNIDTQEVARALKFSTTEVIKKFFNAMSRRAAAMLCEDANFLHCSKEESNSAKAKIFAVVNSLGIKVFSEH